MAADTPGKPSASPMAGAPASASRTPDKPRSAAEHHKVGSRPGVRGATGGREGRRNAGLSRCPTRSPPNQSWRSGAELWGAAEPGPPAHPRPQSSRHSKLEKADILEMTVRHLRSLRRVQVTAALSADPAVLGKYRAGFHECLAEVNRFLADCEGVPADVRSRLLGHLAACLRQLGPSCRPAPAPEVYA
uniref:Hes family bHLH transcription factor 4 n=1 Tax=Rhinopithecus bieti TaxID=61621 RepID=A0A2K6LEK5_RHIBE